MNLIYSPNLHEKEINDLYDQYPMIMVIKEIIELLYKPIYDYSITVDFKMNDNVSIRVSIIIDQRSLKPSKKLNFNLTIDKLELTIISIYSRLEYSKHELYYSDPLFIDHLEVLIV